MEPFEEVIVSSPVVAILFISYEQFRRGTGWDRVFFDRESHEDKSSNWLRKRWQ
jgi:hypothetical protein